VETLRVALIAPPVDLHDGVSRHCADLGAELTRRGHEVIVYSLGRKEALEGPVGLGDGPRLRTVKVTETSEGMGRILSVYRGDVSRAIIADHAHKPFDIVHAHGAYSISLTALRRLHSSPPLVATLHGLEYDRYLHRLNTYHRIPPAYRTPEQLARSAALLFPSYLFALVAYRSADRVICTTEGLARMARTVLHIPESRVDFIPHSISFERFNGPGVCPDSETPFRILYFGRLFVDKGLFTLVESVARLVRRGLKDIRVELRGRGYLAEILARDVQLKGLTNYIAIRKERIPENALMSFYSKFAAFVMPSIYEPGISTAMLEAMASGLPTIASSLETHKSLILRNRTGIVFEPFDAEELAAGIHNLQYGGQRSTYSDRARSTVRDRYSWENNVKLVLDVYRR